MNAIVAVDLNWGIGFKGKLLQNIPEDMDFFKKATIGKVIIMGRETFESLPGGKPLKDRVNIVLSRKGDFSNKQVILCRSIDDLFCELEKYDTKDVFVIGGESVYRELLPFCKEVYLTKIFKNHEADRFFINIDNDDSWRVISASDLKIYNGIEYSFFKYENLRLVGIT